MTTLALGVEWFVSRAVKDPVATSEQMQKLDQIWRSLWVSEARALFLIPVESLVAAWMVSILVREASGQARPDLRTFLKVAPIVVVCGFLNYITVEAAFLLLIVPGFMLLTAWLLVIPALVDEGAGLRSAFSRSRHLTAGFRWRLFALLLLFVIAEAVLNYTAAVLVSGGMTPLKAIRSAAWQDGFRFLFYDLERMGFCAIVASLYVELVTVKEHGLRSTIAEAFS